MTNSDSFIEFKRERDLGTVISDTFKFFRLEWRGLLSVLMTTSLIPFILVFVLSIYNGIEAADHIEENPFGIQFSTLTILTYLAVVLVYHLIVLTVLSYIKVYINNNYEVEYSKVYVLVKSNLINFSILGLLVTVVTVIGAIFCLVPGIYLGIVLSVAAGIFVFEEKSIFDAFGESFPLVNWKWWETFGVVFVVYLLMYVIMFVFSIPSVIYSFIKLGTMMVDQDIEAFGRIFKDPIYLVLTFISNLGQHLIYCLIAIAVTLVYFDLNEQKNATGALETIDKIGK